LAATEVRREKLEVRKLTREPGLGTEEHAVDVQGVVLGPARESSGAAKVLRVGRTEN